MSKPRLFDRLDELTILHQASKIKQLETEIKKLKKLKTMVQTFDICVALLYEMAAFFGTTYKAVNVWIFCIIEPIIFIGLLLRIAHLKLRSN